MSGHGRNACVSLEVDDADAYYAEWRDHVEIKREPRNEDWGARTFDLHDPFGNTVFVMGPVKEEKCEKSAHEDDVICNAALRQSSQLQGRSPQKYTALSTV
jgi:hypothetical protein